MRTEDQRVGGAEEADVSANGSQRLAEEANGSADAPAGRTAPEDSEDWMCELRLAARRSDSIGFAPISTRSDAVTVVGAAGTAAAAAPPPLATWSAASAPEGVSGGRNGESGDPGLSVPAAETAGELPTAAPPCADLDGGARTVT